MIALKVNKSWLWRPHKTVALGETIYSSIYEVRYTDGARICSILSAIVNEVTSLSYDVQYSLIEGEQVVARFRNSFGIQRGWTLDYAGSTYQVNPWKSQVCPDLGVVLRYSIFHCFSYTIEVARDDIDLFVVIFLFEMVHNTW